MPTKSERVIEVATEEEPPLKKQKLPVKPATPSHTLYIKNLNDKLNKQVLKEQLYILFSAYGEVIDVVLLKTAKMRGQAHVVFTSVNDAGIAMRSLQNDVIFGKNLVIEWARTEAHIIEKLSS